MWYQLNKIPPTFRSLFFAYFITVLCFFFDVYFLNSIAKNLFINNQWEEPK